MTVFSRDDKPDPFVPACLIAAPYQYDPLMCLEPELFDLYPDPDETVKRAAVRREEATS